MRIFATLFIMLLAATLQAADVTLVWDASVTPTVTGYRIYYGTAPRNYDRIFSLGNTLTHTVTGLTAGTWYFAATATDDAGNESAYSNEVSQVIPGGTVLPVNLQLAIVPGPVPIILQQSVSAISSSSATITWVTSEACSGTVLYGSGGTLTKTVVANNLGTTDHLAVLSGLASRTHYEYKVQSVCNDKNVESQIRSFNSK